MANQSRFFAAAFGLSILLGPGVITPGAAEPLSPASPDRAEPDGFAPDGSIPGPATIPPRDALWVPLGEPDVTGTGSGARDEDLVAATSTDDGWAEAYCDGSRVPYAAIMATAYPVTLNAQVQFHLDRFTGSSREVVTLWVHRSSRYLAMIREVLRTRGLPEDLAFTAMIESGFKPDAVSRVGAKGMWQFMAGTARRYGLRVDRWVDERRDPEDRLARLLDARPVAPPAARDEGVRAADPRGDGDRPRSRPLRLRLRRGRSCHLRHAHRTPGHRSPAPRHHRRAGARRGPRAQSNARARRDAARRPLDAPPARRRARARGRRAGPEAGAGAGGQQACRGQPRRGHRRRPRRSAA